jgi:type I restriction enzyme S subunit
LPVPLKPRGYTDTKIAILESRRNKTRDLKHGMMQELLTGMTRLV